MIATQARARRLAEIDGATSLSRLADEVVHATIGWTERGLAGDRDATAVSLAVAWLDTVLNATQDPLDLGRSIGEPDAAQALANASGFASEELRDVLAVEAAPDQSAADVFSWLKDRLVAMQRGDAKQDDVDVIQRIFEAIATSMLGSADRLLTPDPGLASWTKSFVS
jgi:hypothetical protein